MVGFWNKTCAPLFFMSPIIFCNIRVPHTCILLFVNNSSIIWQKYCFLDVQWQLINNNVCMIKQLSAVLETTTCDKVRQWIMTSRWFSLGTPVSATNKPDRHDIHVNIISLKVVFNTLTVTIMWNTYLVSKFGVIGQIFFV